jgi:5-methylcytosine-specific restriction endonuclease McrA
VKDKLDKVFSLYIRLRDSKDGYGNCCTCGKRIHYKEGHCGHFISRRHYGTRWNEYNCALQCVKCNLFDQGRQYDFSLYIRRKHGEEVLEEILQRSKETVKFTKSDYEQMIKEYKDKVKEIE